MRALRNVAGLAAVFALLALALAGLHSITDAEASIGYGSGRGGAAGGAANTSRRIVSFSFAVPGDGSYTSVTPGLAGALFGAGTHSGVSGPSRPVLRHAVAAVLNQTSGATSSTTLTRTDWNPILTSSGVQFNGASSGAFIGFDDGNATGSCQIGGANWTNVFQAGSGTCTAVALQGAHILLDSRGTSTGKPMCCAANGGNWTCANILSTAVGSESYKVTLALTPTSVTCTLVDLDLPGVREGSATVSANLPGASALLRLSTGVQSFGGGTTLQVGGVAIDNPF